MSAAVPLIDYVGKSILAPMVRCGTLPLRLLSAQHGADIVYSPEIIDRALIGCTKTVDAKTGVITFGKEAHKGKIREVLRTKPSEQLVLQLGTSSPEWALQAAKVVEDHIIGVDLNMGCPKHFSIQDGMGSALLVQPEKVASIVSTLTRGLRVPVSVKIRLLDSAEQTMIIIRAAVQAGAKAVAIHGRRIEDRPRHKPLYELAAAVVALVKADPALNHVPVIYNGDCFYHSDIQKLREVTGADAVMIARGAMWNASVFQAEMKSVLQMVREYVAIAVEVGNVFANTKYQCIQMLSDHVSTHPGYEAFQRAKTHEDILQHVEAFAQDDAVAGPYRLAEKHTREEKRPEPRLESAKYLVWMSSSKRKSKRAHKRAEKKLKNNRPKAIAEAEAEHAKLMAELAEKQQQQQQQQQQQA